MGCDQGSATWIGVPNAGYPCGGVRVEGLNGCDSGELVVAMKNAVKGRRWGWVLRSGAGIVALLCAVSACGNGRDIESLDPRVVNGIVQRPGGEGYVDRQWVQGQLRALMLPDVQTCLRKRGREDVDADLYLGRFDEIHQTEFPPVSLYRSEGATPSMFTTGLTEEESEQELSLMHI